MGDISVIARRMKDGCVQYGWSGNGGYFKNVGGRLLLWYDDLDRVEYLFGLGQLGLIGAPGSENGGFSWMMTHDLTGRPHYFGANEDEIFSKIAFVDYAYFYDVDDKWYYIVPHCFNIKMPLQLVVHHLDERNYEFDFIQDIERQILEYILGQYREEHQEFKTFLEEKGYCATDLFAEFKDSDFILDRFCDKYESIAHYFDNWIVVEVNEECTEVIGFKIKEMVENHVETCDW